MVQQIDTLKGPEESETLKKHKDRAKPMLENMKKLVEKSEKERNYLVEDVDVAVILSGLETLAQFLGGDDRDQFVKWAETHSFYKNKKGEVLRLNYFEDNGRVQCTLQVVSNRELRALDRVKEGYKRAAQKMKEMKDKIKESELGRNHLVETIAIADNLSGLNTIYRFMPSEKDQAAFIKWVESQTLPKNQTGAEFVIRFGKNPSEITGSFYLFEKGSFYHKKLEEERRQK